MPCRFASSGTVATSRSASRALLALNAASNFLRDLVISVLHRLRQSRTLHTLTFGPISGVHFIGEPFLSPFAAALVGCASETSIARYGSSIPQFPREDLVHQHVRRFYTNTNNAGDQSDHRVWSIIGRLLHLLPASLLYPASLITD